MAPQAAEVRESEFSQQQAAARRQADLDKAAVALRGDFLNQPPALSALHQADDGVVTFLKELCQLGDGGPAAAGKAGDAEQ